jgi:tetratricopeptide (TPR) repeat protein
MILRLIILVVGMFNFSFGIDLRIDSFPKDARIRIMNIKPKYYHGIDLPSGQYHIIIDKKGYTTFEKWINLSNESKYFKVDLNQETIENNTKGLKLQDENILFAEGMTYVFLEKYELALYNLNGAIAINPSFANAYVYRGIVYHKLKKYKLALSDYNHAIKIDPKLTGAYIERGELYDDLGNAELAISNYNHAIKIDPQSTYLYLKRSALYEKSGEYELALSDLSRVIKIDPKTAIALYGRGNIYYDLGNIELALSDFNRALEIDPETMEYLIPIDYKKIDEYKFLLYNYNSALKTNPYDAIAYYNRAILYNDLKKYDLAILDYNRAIEINPQDADFYHNRGVIYLLEYKNIQKAKADAIIASRLGDTRLVTFMNDNGFW